MSQTTLIKWHKFHNKRLQNIITPINRRRLAELKIKVANYLL